MQVTFPAAPDQGAWEVVCAFAAVSPGAEGIEDPKPSPGGGFEAVFYFPPGSDVQDAADQVSGLLASHGLEGARVSDASLVENRDWGEGWREFFKQTRVGRRLYVAPPWEAALPPDAPADAIVVLIEPGQAFGTGTHATTRLCLSALEELAVPGEVLLDIGAGSGILSIAAVKLGATEAIGLERDPVCRGNFLENARLNAVEGRVHLVEGSTPREALGMALMLGVSPPTRIVCNMLSAEFLPILGEIARIPAPLLLTGFLESEREAIAAACREVGYTMAREYSMEEWGAFGLERRGGASR